MLIFAHSIWLGIGAAAAAAGTWALWRSQKQVRPVSSLRLWHNLGAPADGPRRRLVDPLWLLVLVAAVLAALAAAGPQWKAPSPERPEELPIEWSVRSLTPAAPTQPPAVEAWLHLPENLNPYAQLTLIANARRSELTPQALDRSIGIPLPPGVQQVDLALESQGQEVAHQIFTPPPAGSSATPFALLVQNAFGHTVDPALWRVFSLEPGARIGDPTIRPAVLLVDDPRYAAENIPPASLIIASSETPLPGLAPSPILQAPLEGWTPQPAAEAEAALAWPAFSPLDQVRVDALREASLSADWHVLASANDRPWIAARWWSAGADSADRSLLLWLSSSPTDQTTWPANPSFVTFFAEMANRAFAAASDPAHRAPQIVSWTPSSERRQGILNPSPPLYLSKYLALIAMVCLAIASTWFLGRGRPNFIPSAEG